MSPRSVAIMIVSSAICTKMVLSTYLENDHESSNNHPTDSEHQFHTEEEESCSGDVRREGSHDHRSLSSTQALIGLQLAIFPSVDPKFRLIRGPEGGNERHERARSQDTKGEGVENQGDAKVNERRKSVQPLGVKRCQDEDG
jgi:hypothetical protein